MPQCENFVKGASQKIRTFKVPNFRPFLAIWSGSGPSLEFGHGWSHCMLVTVQLKFLFLKFKILIRPRPWQYLGGIKNVLLFLKLGWGVILPNLKFPYHQKLAFLSSPRLVYRLLFMRKTTFNTRSDVNFKVLLGCDSLSP